MPGGSRPTRLGFSSTVLSRTGKSNSRRVSKSNAERSASYRLTRLIAIREGGRENGGESAGAILGIFSWSRRASLISANSACYSLRERSRRSREHSRPKCPCHESSPRESCPNSDRSDPEHQGQFWSKQETRDFEHCHDSLRANQGSCGIRSCRNFAAREEPKRLGPPAALLQLRIPSGCRNSSRRPDTSGREAVSARSSFFSERRWKEVSPDRGTER